MRTTCSRGHGSGRGRARRGLPRRRLDRSGRDQPRLERDVRGDGRRLADRLERKQRLPFARRRQRRRPCGEADGELGRIVDVCLHDVQAGQVGGRGDGVPALGRRPEQPGGPVGVPRAEGDQVRHGDHRRKRAELPLADRGVAVRPGGELHGQDHGRLAHRERAREARRVRRELRHRQHRARDRLIRRRGRRRRHPGAERADGRLRKRDQLHLGHRDVEPLERQRRRGRLRRLPRRDAGGDGRRRDDHVHRPGRAAEHDLRLHGRCVRCRAEHLGRVLAGRPRDDTGGRGGGGGAAAPAPPSPSSSS